jgi:DNA gyrase subunit B
VRRHGDSETYLGERNSRSGNLTYLVKVRDGNEETVHYFHDEKAVRQFHQDNLDLNLLDAELGQELLPLRAPARSNGSRRRGFSLSV